MFRWITSARSASALFLGLVIAIVAALYLAYLNRRLLARISSISEQRNELAQKLVLTQESALHHLSRELHDEFGQILTAIGAMVSRLRKQSTAEPALYSDLSEISRIAQTALDKVRSLSQALHPAILDESGLESALDWFIPRLEKHTGIKISYEKSGISFPVESGAGVHIYRILQEALNNVARHAGAGDASIRLKYLPDALLLEVEDHGLGLDSRPTKRGIGLVVMGERAELIRGKLEFLRPSEGGTLVRLSIPKASLHQHERFEPLVAEGTAGK